MIKAAFFDIAGVVLTDGMKKWVTTFAQKYNFDPKELKTIFAGELSDSYHAGLLSKDEFWLEVFTRLKITPVDIDSLETEWASCYELVPEVKQIILQLKKTIPVYYLSNQTKSRGHVLAQKFNLENIYSGGVYSYNVGLVKPNEQIYKLALYAYETEPQQSVFVDDFESNLVPARALGMNAILCTTPEKLCKDLQSLGCVL